MLASYAGRARELDETIKRFFKPKPSKNSRHAVMPNVPANASGALLVYAPKLKEIF